MTKRKSALSGLSLPMGDQKVSTQLAANGTAAARMKGIRRPSLEVQRSDREAMKGSVTASKIRPAAVMAPRMVSAPRITRPWGMKTG